MCCVVCACTITFGGGFLNLKVFGSRDTYFLSLRVSRCCGPNWADRATSPSSKQGERDIRRMIQQYVVFVYVRVREAEVAL